MKSPPASVATMLVMSRKLGEAIVIDNHVIATLAVLVNDFVEFSLSDISAIAGRDQCGVE